MLYIAADHAGFQMKEHIKRFLEEKGIRVKDLGALTYDKDDDYPDVAHALAKQVSSGAHRGIALCGSGQGMCIAANKTKGVRAALAWNEKSARASRNDDNANVLCLGGRLLSKKTVEACVLAWLETPFSGLARHKRRIRKIE